MCTDIPTDVGNELALTLFRVCEQTLECLAIRNGATTVDVRLRGTDSSLTLTIKYDGAAPKGSEESALTLADMRERMRLMGGRLISRRSEAGGTLMIAKVPLASPIVSA
jgi:signal transduction histidine kinase